MVVMANIKVVTNVLKTKPKADHLELQSRKISDGKEDLISGIGRKETRDHIYFEFLG